MTSPPTGNTPPSLRPTRIGGGVEDERAALMDRLVTLPRFLSKLPSPVNLTWDGQEPR